MLSLLGEGRSVRIFAQDEHAQHPLHRGARVVSCECLVRMKTIPLTQGKVALVDDEDYERISRSSWIACRSKNLWYACRSVRVNGRRLYIAMHQEVMLAKKGQLYDHKNNDGLDCRQSNL